MILGARIDLGVIGSAALALCVAASAAAQDCEVVPLETGTDPDAEPGTESGEVAGVAPAGADACYAIDVGEGRRARIQILEGEVAFAVEGVIEGQEDYAFVADAPAYRVRVGALAGGEAPFVMRVSVAEPPAAAPDRWSVEEDGGRASGRAWTGEVGGPSFALACAGGTEPRLSMTFDGLGTAALVEADASGAPGWIEIEAGGAARRHPVVLARYDGTDRYWEVAEGLSPAFLDDFAAGSMLRLLDAEGAAAGQVGLDGSTQLREALGRECGL